MAMVCVSYFPALFAGYVWDDVAVRDNSLLRSLSGLRQIWLHPSSNYYEHHYWPIVYTTFWLEQRAWGTHPLGYHAVNILLHGFNSVLLWMLLRRMGLRTAWPVAVIFALHPVHVESVAWVIERKDVLSALFCLLSLWFYLQWSEGRKIALYLVSLVLFACAMLSKSAIIGFPVVLGLWLIWKRAKPVAKRATSPPIFKEILPILPYALIAVAIGGGDYLNARSRMESPAGSLSILQRTAIAGRAVWFYVGKFLWPANLVAVYPHWLDPSPIWILWLAPLVVAALILILWARNSRTGLAVLLSLSLFLVGVGPTLGFIGHDFMLYSYVADRFQYLASIGLTLPLASALPGIVGRFQFKAIQWPKSVNRRIKLFNPTQALTALLALLALGILTWRQTETYKSAETLCLHNLAKNPESWSSHNNLGLALRNQGKQKEALFHFQETLKLRPNSVQAANNIADILIERKEWDRAGDILKQVAQIKPDYADGLNNLGVVLKNQGRLEEAKAKYLEAIRLRPDAAEWRVNLGNLLNEQNQTEAAKEQYLAALQLNPNLSDAHNNLGIILAKSGNNEEARKQFGEAVRIKPEYPNAQNNLANVLAMTGDLDGAIEHGLKAVELDPNFFEARFNLGNCFSKKGDWDAAIRSYNEALRIQPASAQAHNNLGIVLARQGKMDEAARHFETALQLKPDYPNARENLERARKMRKGS